MDLREKLGQMRIVVGHGAGIMTVLHLLQLRLFFQKVSELTIQVVHCYLLRIFKRKISINLLFTSEVPIFHRASKKLPCRKTSATSIDAIAGSGCLSLFDSSWMCCKMDGVRTYDIWDLWNTTASHKTIRSIFSCILKSTKIELMSHIKPTRSH